MRKDFTVKSICIVLFLSITLRQIWIHSVIERDEGGIAIIALQWIKDFPPYINSLNNAGPLSYLTYSISTYIFGTTLVPIRMINNILFYLSILTLFLLLKQICGKKIAFYSSLFYGIFSSAPIYEGQLAITSSLSAPFVVFSLYFLFEYIKINSRSKLFLSSILLSCAALIKVHLVFGLGLIFLVIFLKSRKHSRIGLFKKELLTDSIFMVTGFVLLPLLFLIYFWKIGAIDEIFHIFLNLTVGGHLKLPPIPFGITFNVLFQGLPLLIFSIIGVITIREYLIKKRYNFLIFLGWLILTSILAVFPPHFGHRYIYLIAPLAIFAGIGLAFTIMKIKSTSLKKIENKYRITLKSLLTLILLSSFLIAGYFQSSQFPQYHITSEDLQLNWRYSDADSYSTQINLAKFLQNQTTTGDQILIHGWTGTIYYLVNRFPPSKYVWTVPGIGIDIPEEEYNKLLDNIKGFNFKYIVIFDSDLDNIENRRNDPIVDLTLNRYFFLKNIDNAHIFKNSNFEREQIFFNFVEKFNQSYKKYSFNNTINDFEENYDKDSIFFPTIKSIKLGNETRRAIFQHPINEGESIISYNITIPSKTIIEFGLTLDPYVWNSNGDGVEFKIRLSNQEFSQIIFSYFLEPNNIEINEKVHEWYDFRLNLNEFEDFNVLIDFITSPGFKGNAGFDWAYWSKPLLLQGE